MNRHAVYHRPKSNYCFAYDNNKVYIRLRAAKGDLSKAILIYCDKYEWDKKKECNMELTCSDKDFDYYTAVIKAPNNRLSYYFALESKDERCCYTEWGVVKEVKEDELLDHFFNLPYINNIDIHRVPEWVKDSIFYLIFPERFKNGDKSIDPKGVEEWGNAPKRDNYFGGDLKGITEKIDYLNDLGINAIYMTPIFKANTNHKYDTTDYMEIDPCFGDKDTLKKLVKEAHKRGIRVILDAVFNHCGYLFKPFQDVLEKGKDSKYYNWFHIRKWPLEKNPPSYEAFAFEAHMPKINTENPEVKEYILGVARYWIEEADIDGWRLDVANEIDHEFWRDFRKVVKGTKEDAFIIGEIWHNSLPWLMGDQFDSIMNYPVTNACFKYFAYNNIDHIEFKELISNTTMRYTKQVNDVLFNLLDSHDTSRFLTKCSGDTRKLKLAAGFMLTFTGTPCIYYGTEVGMEGGDDPDCRKTMQWNEEKWDKDLFSFYKTLIALRKEHSALRRGGFEWIDTESDVVGYIRETEDEKIVVIINNSDEIKKFELDNCANSCTDLLKNEEIILKENKINLMLKGYEIKVLSL